MDGNSIKLLGGGEPTTRWPPAAAVASHYKFKWMVIAHLVLRKGARSGAAKKRRTKDHQPEAGAFRTWDKWGISGGDYGQSDGPGGSDLKESGVD